MTLQCARKNRTYKIKHENYGFFFFFCPRLNTEYTYSIHYNRKKKKREIKIVFRVIEIARIAAFVILLHSFPLDFFFFLVLRRTFVVRNVKKKKNRLSSVVSLERSKILVEPVARLSGGYYIYNMLSIKKNYVIAYNKYGKRNRLKANYANRRDARWK